MEIVTVLLMFLTVSGHSLIFQPKLTVTQIAGLDRDPQSEMRSEQLSDVSTLVEEKEKPAETTERRKTEEQEREGLTPVPNPFAHNIEEILDSNQGHVKGSEERITTPETSSKMSGEETKRGEFSAAVVVKDLDTENGDDGDRREEEGLHLGTHEENKSVKAITTDNTYTWEAMGNDGETRETIMESPHRDKLRPKLVDEERVSRLVAGLLEESWDFHGIEEDTIIINSEEEAGINERWKGAEEWLNMENGNHNELVEREKEDHISIHTPHLSTSSTQVGKVFEIPTTIQTITHTQNPPLVGHSVTPSLLVPPTQDPSVSSNPPTAAHVKASPQFFPPSAAVPETTTINHISTSTGEVRSDSLLEDLLTEVLHSPGHHLKQNEQDVEVSPHMEDVTVENALFKSAWKEQQTTKEVNTVVQPDEAEFLPTINSATPKPKEETFITEDSKEPNFTPKSNENNPTAKPLQVTHTMTQPTSNTKTVKLMENGTKLTTKQNKTSPPKPQLTKPSAKRRLTTDKTPSMRPTKINRSSKNKTIKKSKEKKRKKNNKTQKPQEKVIPPTHFPYFLDNYCPPECACYGRVVQCSDKGVDKVPYGIPYNARYILLMNNQINSIQLDLLNEYVSMEFLVLSNNRLTDSSIEGAFEGVPALKRLYLDTNLLESLPTDLPVSLEELRLDNNQLSVLSEAAWARCPSLLVLSLRNNSLGNGSESLADAALSPLCNLRILNLDHNQLPSVPQGLPLSIKELYLKGNLIEQFRGGAFNGTSELLILDLSANRLTNRGLFRESLRNAIHLESLNLEGNRLKHVPRHLPRSLKTLNLEGNRISSIKKGIFSTLKNLEHLGLARNKIVKVAPGAFKSLPVLYQLDLCRNNLHQVPRQLPQALHTVALTHNKIQSVPRDAFCWGSKSISLSRLVRVQLEHNLIDMGNLDAQAFRCLRGFQVVHFY